MLKLYSKQYWPLICCCIVWNYCVLLLPIWKGREERGGGVRDGGLQWKEEVGWRKGWDGEATKTVLSGLSAHLCRYVVV